MFKYFIPSFFHLIPSQSSLKH